MLIISAECAEILPATIKFECRHVYRSKGTESYYQLC